MSLRPLLLLAVLAAMIVAACGGASSPSPTATATPPASEAPTTEPTEAPTAEPTDEASVAPSGGPGIDLGEAAEALENIDSYKIVMTIEGETDASVQATIVRQPELAQDITVESAGVQQRIIVIGDSAWMDAGTGSFTEVPASVAGGLSSAFDPITLLGAFSQPSVAAAMEQVGQEERNGVQTTHYRLNEDSPGAALASIPPGGSLEVWLAEEGYLVAMEAVNLNDTTTLVRMDVTDVNSPDNVVEAPE
jgi:hypothetical protein